MPAPPATSVLEHEVRIAASPETVFGYFTDPSRFVLWMGAEATLDPRPGGICRIAFAPSADQLEAVRASVGDALKPKGRPTGVMSGRFVEVDPPHRVSFTWGWEDAPFTVPPQSTEVEVSLTPEGDETVVRLTHRRLPAPAIAFHRAGWEHFLPRLRVAAGGGDPGPDPWSLS